MTTITTRLIGGLGNQMFQYAAARAQALRRGAQVRLDLSSFEDQLPGNTPRHYELDKYPVAATIADPIAGKASIEQADPTLLVRLGRLVGLQRPAAGAGNGLAVTPYREPHFRFDPKLAQQPLPLLMDGYWQSERYFKDAAEYIRTELTPTAPLEPDNAATFAAIVKVEAVSVHIRRGDYVANAQTNAYHGTCSLDYYSQAIEFVRSRVERPHLFVFSDDPDWTRANLVADLPTTYVSANLSDRGYRDMQLMSCCRHHIIANSSFSWWGAWLNPEPAKIVVAPARWFAKPGTDTSDLVPKEWNRI